ncbi:MAG: retention module-containing protein, partial [Burkholderiales bacterium]
MATAASGNAGVGTIKVVTGDVKVIGVDGVARQAQVGDKVFARETIQTNANAIVQVQLENGRMLDLGRDSKISLDNDVIGTQGPATTQAPTQDIAALQAQIAAGADPSKVAEATAAGGAPGAGGGA